MRGSVAPNQRQKGGYLDFFQSTSNRVAYARTRNIGVLMSSELRYMHIHARLLPRHGSYSSTGFPDGLTRTFSVQIYVQRLRALRYTAMVTMVMCGVLMTVANRRGVIAKYPHARTRAKSEGQSAADALS